jgi:hypothetical protein
MVDSRNIVSLSTLHWPGIGGILLIDELKLIASNDPDGKAEKPTDADYQRFQAWVMKAYGEEAVEEYYGTNWDRTFYE